ncbi:hypothetical protein ACP4OV_017933 [Aristida adscensionis]
MDYSGFESSGTDDDIPPAYQIRGPRILFNGDGRSSGGAFSQPMTHSNLDSDMHQIEQQAYTGVLRAFKLQSNAITWEKESLMAELRRELKVTDEEHRVLLKKVNDEEAVHKTRRSGLGGRMQSSLHVSGNVVPPKRHKKSHSIHPLPMAPEDIRWSSGNQILLSQDGWPANRLLKWHPSNNGLMLGAERIRGRFLAHEDHGLPNGFRTENLNHMAIPNTGNMLKEVERVLSNPDMYEIEKAKELLRDQEQSLLDAIARLDEESDSENEEAMPVEAHLGTTVGQHEL